MTQGGRGPGSLPVPLVPDLGLGEVRPAPFGLLEAGPSCFPREWGGLGPPAPGSHGRAAPSVGEARLLVRSSPGPLWPGVAQRVPSLLRLLREQWIRAKYERQEFAHPERQEPYSAGEAAPAWASAPATAPQSWSRAPRNLGGRFRVWARVPPPALSTGWLTWPQGPYSCSQVRPEPCLRVALWALGGCAFGPAGRAGLSAGAWTGLGPRWAWRGWARPRGLGQHRAAAAAVIRRGQQGTSPRTVCRPRGSAYAPLLPGRRLQDWAVALIQLPSTPESRELVGAAPCSAPGLTLVLPEAPGCSPHSLSPVSQERTPQGSGTCARGLSSEAGCRLLSSGPLAVGVQPRGRQADRRVGSRGAGSRPSLTLGLSQRSGP